MFCKQCGIELKDGSAFCTNCGAKQGSEHGSGEIRNIKVV